MATDPLDEILQRYGVTPPPGWPKDRPWPPTAKKDATLANMLTRDIKSAVQWLVEPAKEGYRIGRALQAPKEPLAPRTIGPAPQGARPLPVGKWTNIEETAKDIVPGTAELRAGAEAVRKARGGNYGAAALAGLGAIPLLGKAKKAEDAEKIIAVANRALGKNGRERIFVHRIHQLAKNAMEEKGINIHNIEEGYLTSHGRFVDREAANELPIAQRKKNRAGPVKSEDFLPGELDPMHTGELTPKMLEAMRDPRQRWRVKEFGKLRDKDYESSMPELMKKVEAKEKKVFGTQPKAVADTLYHGTLRNFTSFAEPENDLGVHLGTRGQAAARVDAKLSQYIDRVPDNPADRHPQMLKVVTNPKKVLPLRDDKNWILHSPEVKLTDLASTNLRTQLSQQFPNDAAAVMRLGTHADVRDFLKRKGYDAGRYLNEYERSVPDGTTDPAFAALNKKVMSTGLKSLSVDERQLWDMYKDALGSEGRAPSTVVFDPKDAKIVASMDMSDKAIQERGNFAVGLFQKGATPKQIAAESDARFWRPRGDSVVAKTARAVGGQNPEYLTRLRLDEYVKNEISTKNPTAGRYARDLLYAKRNGKPLPEPPVGLGAGWSKRVHEELAKVERENYYVPPSQVPLSPTFAKREAIRKQLQSASTVVADFHPYTPATYTAKSGNVYAATSHADALQEARAAGEPEAVLALSKEPSSDKAKAHRDALTRMGFLDENEQVLTRHEAARRMDQLDGTTEFPTFGLMTEDISRRKDAVGGQSPAASAVAALQNAKILGTVEEINAEKARRATFGDSIVAKAAKVGTSAQVPTKEVVGLPTIKVGKKVFTGDTHGDAWLNAGRPEKGTFTEGFATNKRKHISRREAYRVADDAGQNPEPSASHMLDMDELAHNTYDRPLEANKKLSAFAKRQQEQRDATLKKKLGVIPDSAVTRGVPAVASLLKSLQRPDALNLPRVSKVSPEHGARFARTYESLPKNDPAAAEAYKALNAEVEQQFKAMQDAGYKVEFVDHDPYKSSAEMMADVRDNKRLKVFKTGAGQEHPFMTPEQNDKFRAVHDWLAHAGEGHQFGPTGEENAYRVHASTLSPLARRALATETRGQNSWVNFGPNAHLPAKERPFAEQKAALWPEELTGDYPKTSADSVGTRVMRAAIQLKDGRVFPGASHFAAVQDALAAGAPQSSLEDAVSGFVTDNNTFLPHAEATRVTRANPLGLRSEDIPVNGKRIVRKPRDFRTSLNAALAKNPQTDVEQFAKEWRARGGVVADSVGGRVVKKAITPPKTADDHIANLRAVGEHDAADALAKYMEGSKVRERLFHGTAAGDIDVFNGSRGAAGHFTSWPSIADDFAVGAAYEAAQHSDELRAMTEPIPDYMLKAGAQTYPVFVNAKNPFDIRNPTHRLLLGIPSDRAVDYFELERNLNKIRDAGFDSYHDFERAGETRPTGLAVFDPRQIKSATGNRGTFDPRDPRLTFGLFGAGLGLNALRPDSTSLWNLLSQP